jgi:hypothetical protein
MLSGGLRLAISAKKIICTSFDNSWKCLRCGPHSQEEAFKIRGVADSSSPRQAVALADQSFPVCLPTDGQKECVKIAVIENGSLEDLASEFLRLLGNRRVPKGSVVMIHSSWHLANVGTAQYAVDLLAAMAKIKTALGKETICIPLPPFILGGTTNKELIRSCLELMAWYEDYFEEGLSVSFLKLAQLINDTSEGAKVQHESRRLTLPANNNPNGKRVWESGGQDSKAMPCIIKPATPSQETQMIACIVDELRVKFGLNLELNPSHDRSVGPKIKPKRKGDLLLVGSSNASKMSALLSERGKPTGLLFSPGWTITRTSAEQMAANISRKLSEEDPAVVVLHLMDNSVFYVKKEDGSRQLPQQDMAGIYHVDGELRVCAGEVQEDHFRAMRPIFDIIGRRKCIWVAPIPRYVTAGCCNNRSHVSNRCDQYYLEDMRLQLDGLKRHMKEHVYAMGKKNVKVYDPNSDLREFTSEEIWGEDPIHPSRQVLLKMGESIIAMVDSMNAETPREGGSGNTRGRGSTRGQGRPFRGRWQDGRRGGDTRHEDSYNNPGGRHISPGYPRGGRVERGGHLDYRARPY